MALLHQLFYNVELESAGQEKKKKNVRKFIYTYGSAETEAAMH